MLPRPDMDFSNAEEGYKTMPCWNVEEIGVVYSELLFLAHVMNRVKKDKWLFDIEIIIVWTITPWGPGYCNSGKPVQYTYIMYAHWPLCVSDSRTPTGWMLLSDLVPIQCWSY